MGLLEEIDKKFKLYESSEYDETSEDESEDELDEMSTTGSMDGGAGPIKTPRAFKKKGSKYKSKNADKPFKKIAKESKFKKMAKAVHLNEVNYKEFKEDDKSAKHKVNKRLREINGLLYQLEIMVGQAKKLKSETGLTQDHIWKTNEKRISRIKERLLRISKDIVEINS